MTDKRTIAAYDARADEYTKLVSRTKPDGDLQAFIDAVRPGGAVLDLGCGPGNSAAMMRDAGLQVEAWDASAQMVETARTRFRIDARKATFDDLKAVGAYDGIWANFSLLHAPKEDMPRHLSAIHTALKSGGVFHIGVKTGTGADRDTIGRMYSYYTVPELTDLLAAAGFTPRSQREGAEKGLSGDISDYVIILCNG